MFCKHSGWIFVSFLLTGVVLSTLSGCGSSPSVVSGSVSYNGQPVGDGHVVFQPADGKGASCGGPIKNGKYTVETTPGKKVVQIIAVKKVKYGRRSPQEEARLLREAAARGDRSGVIESADAIPPNAQGNNKQVDVQSGSQTMDFNLMPPMGRTGS